MELPLTKPGYNTTYKPGYGTEYTDNYHWDQYYKSQELNRELLCRPLCGAAEQSDCCLTKTYDGKKEQDLRQLARPCELTGRNPAVFQSTEYPCVYRETVVHKDDRERYIDPFKDVITTPSGRRLMYDSSHPDMIFASQWSSELADPPGPYSFPVTTELEPEIPWTKEMQWQVESEVGKWPTDLWKTWTKTAACPCYDGYDDQIQYSKYKVNVP